jgi:hypothetical protein
VAARRVPRRGTAQPRPSTLLLRQLPHKKNAGAFAPARYAQSRFLEQLPAHIPDRTEQARSQQSKGSRLGG